MLTVLVRDNGFHHVKPQIDQPMLNGLYVLTNSQYYALHEWPERIEKIILAGANIIQFREKQLSVQELLPYAQQIRDICFSYGAIFIINDHLSLAKKVNADGVHIGKYDQSLRHARHYLGRDYIIGVSCYNRLYNAVQAQIHGADYVAFGSVFSSRTKINAHRCPLAVIYQSKRCLSIPVCAIGGITQNNISHVVNAGADIFATSHAVFNADSPGYAANKINQQVIMSR